MSSTTETTIVGWDGSLEAQAALDWAVRRATRRGGSLHVLSVMEPFPFMETEALMGDAIADRAVRSLDDEVESIRARTPELHLSSELITGDPTEEFLARSSPTTALVFGTRHRSAPYFRFAWSFGGQLAAHARGPVVIVPDNASSSGRGILVGVDGSDESEVAVRYAAHEARAAHTSLDLVHAWLGPLANPVPGFEVEKAPWLIDAHRKTIDRAVALAREEWPEIQAVVHVEVDTASHALLHRARDAELVVVGARGRSPLASLAFGSVSTALLAVMPCPVAILGPETVLARTPHDPTPATALR